MKESILLRKTCTIYASDTHFATLIFPFIKKEVENKTEIITILEKNETDKIERILKNIGLNPKIKKKIRNIDWKKTNIKKIKKNFENMQSYIKKRKNINIIVLGERVFIKKTNEIIDLWFKNNIEKIEKSKIQINIINCFSFYESIEIQRVIKSHNYILKTTGLEKIENKIMMKAN